MVFHSHFINYIVWNVYSSILIIEKIFFENFKDFPKVPLILHIQTFLFPFPVNWSNLVQDFHLIIAWLNAWAFFNIILMIFHKILFCKLRTILESHHGKWHSSWKLQPMSKYKSLRMFQSSLTVQLSETLIFFY